MSIPTVGLNEDAPAAGNYIREGDDRIREYKTQNREIMEVDHVYPSSGQDADAGKHKQVSLVEAADIGSGAEGLPILGAQTEGVYYEMNIEFGRLIDNRTAFFFKRFTEHSGRIIRLR